MTWNDDSDAVQFSEPILAKKDVKVRIDFAEPAEWEVKVKDKWSDADREAMREFVGKKFKAMGLNLTITDSDVKTEHADAKPKVSLTTQLNLDKYPFPKDGTVQYMGRQGLYDLQGALGFDPVFVVNGRQVEPYITKTGNKVAPKIEGVKQVINPDFFSAYFNPDGTVNPTNWIDKVIYVDVELERNEQYGDRNNVTRFKRRPI